MVATATSDELGLHQRLLSHDIVALAEVYDRYAATVFGVARRVTADRHAAEDVTQHVLLDLWRRPERFHPERGALRPWLATIAHNRSVDWIRHEQAARGRDRTNLERSLAEQVPDVDGDVQAWMTAQRLRQAVAALLRSKNWLYGWPSFPVSPTGRSRRTWTYLKARSSPGSGRGCGVCR